MPCYCRLCVLPCDMSEQSKNSGPVVLAGFTVIPVKFDEESKVCHYLYVKGHCVRGVDSDKPQDRTLLVLNVPPYCNEECLERLFGENGVVEKVIVQKKPYSKKTDENYSKHFPSVPIEGYTVAYIVFSNESSIEKVKQLPSYKHLFFSTLENPVVSGVEKWCAEYSQGKQKIKDLQNEVDNYMQDYDTNIEEEKRKDKKSEGQEDEDGWITVTKHNRNKAAPRKEITEKNIVVREKKRRKEKELLNFYTFQLRDTKKEKIAELRRKFEEDKNKIATLKANRKFRPY